MKKTLHPQTRALTSALQKTRGIRLMMGMLTLTAAAALMAIAAHAQTPEAGVAPPAAATASAVAAPAAQAPKYAAQDVERVFNYLDTNRDGKISREEAAAFKNIANHFDGADTNKDNFLTREEFDGAVNGRKPQ